MLDRVYSVYAAAGVRFPVDRSRTRNKSYRTTGDVIVKSSTEYIGLLLSFQHANVARGIHYIG